MTTERRPRFDRTGATVWLAAALIGLGSGAALRLYAPPVAAAALAPTATTLNASASGQPIVVVVRGGAGRPAARTRAS